MVGPGFVRLKGGRIRRHVSLEREAGVRCGLSGSQASMQLEKTELVGAWSAIGMGVDVDC